MDDLLYEIKRLEKLVRTRDLETSALQVTKIHSYAFLSKKSRPVLERHKLRLEKRLSIYQGSDQQTRLFDQTTTPVVHQHYQQAPSLLYSSDWMTVVSSLAEIAKKSPTACVIALGLGDPGQNLRPGLLWIVSPDRVPKLINKKAFESMFRTCQQRKETQYIMGLLTLSSKRYPQAHHILSYIYDIYQNEIEIFDPNGGLQFKKEFGYNVYADFMDRYFQLGNFNSCVRRYFGQKLGIRNVYASTQWCPVGIQRIQEQEKSNTFAEKQKDFGGYCAAWSIWWLQQRLQYPTMERSQLLIRLTKQFENENINLKQFILAFSQQLSNTKVQLMRTALHMGGRPEDEINYMLNIYSRAETKCRRASNLLFHESKDSIIQNYAKKMCYYTKHITNPILAEVTANLEPAVQAFSNGRIALRRG